MAHMSPQNMTETEMLLHDAERSYKRALNSLNEAARHLSNDMRRVGEAIDRDSEDPSINSLGEVQQRGANVDRWCAIVEERRQHLAMIRHFAKSNPGN